MHFYEKIHKKSVYFYTLSHPQCSYTCFSFFLFIFFFTNPPAVVVFLLQVYMYLHASESRCWNGAFLTKTHLINSPHRLYQLVFSVCGSNCFETCSRILSPGEKAFFFYQTVTKYLFFSFALEKSDSNETGSRITSCFSIFLFITSYIDDSQYRECSRLWPQ